LNVKQTPIFINPSFMTKSNIVITCAKGIAPYLVEELLLQGFPILSEDSAAVEIEGTLEDTMRLNLFLRTGQRILFLLYAFEARNPDELYTQISALPWENHIAADGYVCITSSVDTPTINDSRFANVRCKDAIVDRFYKKAGRRPDSGPERDRVVIHLYWRGKECRIFLDTSGEPLSRRGYRKIPGQAPMQETLAAATLLAAGWDGQSHFVNPMCGSGTLAIEAALLALKKAPGLLRSQFGFMHWKGFDETSWKELRKQARKGTEKSIRGRIIATDIRKEAVEAAKQNAKTAGVDALIEFGVCDYSRTPIPEGGGVIMINPPYGERLGEKKELEETYGGIGDFFKKRCSGYRGYIFTGNLDLAKKVELRTRRRLLFFNGEIECRLLEYELYEGSRKAVTT
jgi:23S rRNA G2445 N2-methylase RlmL